MHVHSRKAWVSKPPRKCHGKRCALASQLASGLYSDIYVCFMWTKMYRSYRYAVADDDGDDGCSSTA